MIGIKFLFVIAFSVISVRSANGQWSEAIITNFRGGGLGAMGERCLDRDLLEVKKYEDFAFVFDKPSGANEYFLTSSEGINEYCMEIFSSFYGNVDYEVRMLVYTTISLRSLTLSVIDIETSEVLTSEDINDKLWTYSTIKLTRFSRYKIRLEYKKLNDDDNTFFAIDELVLKYTIPTEAPLTDPLETTKPTNPTENTLYTTEGPPTEPTVAPIEVPSTYSTTLPTEATETLPTDSPSTTVVTVTVPTDSQSTTDPTDSTPPPEIQTDPTEHTTSEPLSTTDVTRPTPEPPASVPCKNCICNCNYYCTPKTILP